MGRLLLVEDDKNIQDFNKELLEDRGYTITLAMNLREARERLAEGVADLIVLDVMLPDGSGFDFLAELRKTSRVPVLMLSAKGELADRVQGYDTGADDYLPKPYQEEELVRKVSAILKRAGQEPERIKLGALLLDIQSGRAFINGLDLGLTPKDYDLLRFFVQNKDRLISAADLYKTVWGQPMIDDNRAVKVATSRLRTKLEGSGFTIAFDKEMDGYSFKTKK